MTATARRYDLVIFDCDGVLVDSEVISCRIHAEALTRHGYPISVDQLRERFLGKSAADNNRSVEIEMGRSLPPTFEAERVATLLQALRESVQPIPHIHHALDAITVPQCVASSGTRDKIFTTLSRTGLYEKLAPHIFSASQVSRGKPAPDLFLFAAEAMNVSPQRSVVIEDSVSGVAAGISAGMTVLGFVGGSHCVAGDGDKLRAAGATVVFDDMRRLPELIAPDVAR
jgi:HAD superfamily hydrolase (TIGR01509 family)